MDKEFELYLDETQAQISFSTILTEDISRKIHKVYKENPVMLIITNHFDQTILKKFCKKLKEIKQNSYAFSIEQKVA